MKRAAKIAYNYMLKNAYVFKWDTVNLTDLITDGVDVNIASEEILSRAVWQECAFELKDMQAREKLDYDFYYKRIFELLTRAGVKDLSKKEAISQNVATSFMDYLAERGV